MIRTAIQAGLIEIHREPDPSAEESIECFIYVILHGSSIPGK